eukprot:gene11752-34478_t
MAFTGALDDLSRLRKTHSIYQKHRLGIEDPTALFTGEKSALPATPSPRELPGAQEFLDNGGDDTNCSLTRVKSQGFFNIDLNARSPIVASPKGSPRRPLVPQPTKSNTWRDVLPNQTTLDMLLDGEGMTSRQEIDDSGFKDIEAVLFGRGECSQATALADDGSTPGSPLSPSNFTSTRHALASAGTSPARTARSARLRGTSCKTLDSPRMSTMGTGGGLAPQASCTELHKDSSMSGGVCGSPRRSAPPSPAVLFPQASYNELHKDSCMSGGGSGSPRRSAPPSPAVLFPQASYTEQHKDSCMSPRMAGELRGSPSCQSPCISTNPGSVRKEASTVTHASELGTRNSGHGNSGNSGNSGHSKSGNSGNSGKSGHTKSGNSGNSGHSKSGNSGHGNSGHGNLSALGSFASTLAGSPSSAPLCSQTTVVPSPALSRPSSFKSDRISSPTMLSPQASCTELHKDSCISGGGSGSPRRSAPPSPAVLFPQASYNDLHKDSCMSPRTSGGLRGSPRQGTPASAPTTPRGGSPFHSTSSSGPNSPSVLHQRRQQRISSAFSAKTAIERHNRFQAPGGMGSSSPVVGAAGASLLSGMSPRSLRVKIPTEEENGPQTVSPNPLDGLEDVKLATPLANTKSHWVFPFTNT